MTLIPHRTVASQIAAHLREEIALGTWRGWLPSERALSHSLQASRNSLRAALGQLKGEGVVASVAGFGHRIVGAPATASRPRTDKSQNVGLLIPEAIGSLRPLVALWIDELKDLLAANCCRLHVHEGSRYFGSHAARELPRLVDQHRHQVWVLALSSEPLQRWFDQSKLPCVVAGGLYPGVTLSSLDLDYRTLCRHAVGVLLGLGHRRLALLNREPRRPGDYESEVGFVEGVRDSRHPEATADVASYHEDIASIGRALDRLFAKKKPPTALLVCNSHIYLAVCTLLAQRGLRIPQDVSLISRDDDQFLRFVAPSPARYVFTPGAFARKFLHSILLLSEAGVLRPSTTLLLPKFVTGGSVARFTAASSRPATRRGPEKGPRDSVWRRPPARDDSGL